MDQNTAVTIANSWFVSLGILLVVMASIYFYAVRDRKTTSRKQ